MRTVIIILAIIGLAFLIFTFTRNEPDNALDKTQYTIEEAVEETGDAIDEAGDKIEDAAQ